MKQSDQNTQGTQCSIRHAAGRKSPRISGPRYELAKFKSFPVSYRFRSDPTETGGNLLKIGFDSSRNIWIDTNDTVKNASDIATITGENRAGIRALKFSHL